MAEVIVALDVAGVAPALDLVDRLGPEVDFVKIGLELYTRAGPEVVHEMKARGLRVFLDLKLHDIPATVSGATRAAAALGVDLLTLHASGGRRMLEAAVRAAEAEAPTTSGGSGLRLLGVTVLTSLAAPEVAEGWGRDPRSLDPQAEVLRLAALSHESGVHGVVASPWEARALRARLGPDAPIVTPGIRFAGEDAHDQTRIATPFDAVQAGADHLVIGRAVTAAPDPQRALARVREEIARLEGVSP